MDDSTQPSPAGRLDALLEDDRSEEAVACLERLTAADTETRKTALRALREGAETKPDALAIRIQGEITREYFDDEIVSHLRSHDVASDLAAVRNDRVIYGGVTYQGPIIHLFQLERAAQELYPDEFGGERLFDRQRVADIVNGAVER